MKLASKDVPFKGKTLKDFSHKLIRECDCGRKHTLEVVYPTIELREEAIKWVKSDGKFLVKYFSKKTKQHVKAMDFMTGNTQRWVMHFFNITEDDLK